MRRTRETHGRKFLDMENCEDITWKTRHRWDDNIKVDFTEIGWRGCGLDSSVSEYGFCEHGNGHSDKK
jgi:hypothetical protein